MNTEANIGAALVVVMGGLVHGSFALPMKRMIRWKWENTWLVYSVVGLIVIPIILAAATVPGLFDVYRGSSANTLAAVVAFGFGWGVGSTLFGLGIARVGMALAFALILGITSSVGSLLPLIVLSPDELWTRKGAMLTLGLAIVIVGIVFCSMAGAQRERDANAGRSGAPSKGFGTGLLICIASGLTSPMLNFSFVFGKPIQDLAAAAGASQSLAANSIWAPALAGGFLANAGYAAYLLMRNRTWGAYTQPGTSPLYWIGASAMGLVWFGGIAIYGMGAAAMGRLGPVLGWPVFMSVVIITANVWGALSGEWKAAGTRARALSWTGIAILIGAIVVISMAA